MGKTSEHDDGATPGRPETVVGAGVTIRGDIEGVTDLHVHGVVIGKVAVADLVVEADATVDGPVTAEAVVVGGRMIGPLRARTAHFRASARMDGDVTCESIQIDPGARFTGRCNAEDAFSDKIVPLPRAPDGDDGLLDAGEEFLRLAARLRAVAS